MIVEDRRRTLTRLATLQYLIAVLFAVLAVGFWVLQIVQHAKFEEMAEILSCPVSTVKSRLYAALELLKTDLSPLKVRGAV